MLWVFSPPAPHLGVVLLGQVGMVVVGNPRCCICFWTRAGCLAFLVSAGNPAGLIPG